MGNFTSQVQALNEAVWFAAYDNVTNGHNPQCIAKRCQCFYFFHEDRAGPLAEFVVRKNATVTVQAFDCLRFSAPITTYATAGAWKEAFTEAEFRVTSSSHFPTPLGRVIGGYMGMYACFVDYSSLYYLLHDAFQPKNIARPKPNICPICDLGSRYMPFMPFMPAGHSVFLSGKWDDRKSHAILSIDPPRRFENAQPATNRIP